MPAVRPPLCVQIASILQTLSSISFICKLRSRLSIASYVHKTNLFAHLLVLTDRLEAAL
jgi:hypothetical protein